MEKNQVTILGARGSIPVSGSRYSIYGGATSCVLLEAAGEAVLFDAGSGLMNLPQRVRKEYAKIHIFLSHFHLDHLMGIPMSSMMYDPSAEVIFYAEDGEKIPEVIRQMMAEPLWPVGPDSFRAKLGFCSIDTQPVILGAEKTAGGTEQSLTITAVPVTHPGGALAFRADWGDHSIVYATDCDPDEGTGRSLERFAADTDLFILDAQYTDEEYEQCRGFGHPSMRTSAQIIAASGAGQGLLFHHSPTHTDEQLGTYERQLQQFRKNTSFAREGDRITL
ncbi:MAG: MBL fold metallo-hydrolase [Lachnospiraceae bacterium]